jgi:hypothetical protein
MTCNETTPGRHAAQVAELDQLVAATAARIRQDGEQDAFDRVLAGALIVAHVNPMVLAAGFTYLVVELAKRDNRDSDEAAWFPDRDAKPAAAAIPHDGWFIHRSPR